jgi:ABC-type bacteriocin/lantibiotic exporter with double-glycine peptidase domain
MFVLKLGLEGYILAFMKNAEYLPSEFEIKFKKNIMKKKQSYTKEILDLISSKYIYICFVLLFIQQLMVASSTIFIAELAKSIASGYISWVSFYCFIASLTMVYFPASLARVYLEKARYQAQHNYNQLFINSHKDKIHLSQHDESEKMPFIISEGPLTINYSLFFFFDTFSVTLNVLVSLLALSYIIYPPLLFIYGIGFTLLCLFIYFTRSIIKFSSQEAQLSRAENQTQLLKSWNNITINNKYNFSIWYKKYEEVFKNLVGKNVSNEVYKQIISTSGMFLSLLPLLIALTFLLYTNGNDLAFQAMLVATLPRQIQMIQNLELIIQHFSAWTEIKERLKGLVNILDVNIEKPEERIQWDKIQFSNSSNFLEISSFEELRQILQSSFPTRLTIRGENGSGKSTLLKCLKERLGGYYLPASGSLSFNANNVKSASTGQHMLAAIKEINSIEHQEKLLLFDEWDANLDQMNREKISQEIDALALKINIIEVIHRT